MTKIKELIKNLIANYKNNIKQYSATNTVIIITTLILTFASNNLTNIFIKRFMLIAIMCAINFFTIETYSEKIKQKKLPYIVGIVIAIGINYIVKLNNTQAIHRVIIGYSIIVFLIGIFKIIKQSQLEVKKYLIRTFKNLFNTGIIYLILNIGLTVILSIFIMLLLENIFSLNLIIRMQIALLGLYAIPAGIIAITNTKTETTKFIKNIVCVVLLPLTIIATAIIYIYMAKIFILRQIPKNAIFRILSGLFITSFPIWVMASNYKEKVKIMPFTFIPFIGLQIYSIGARCYQSGLTPIRYIGIMFIIFEAVAIALFEYKKQKYLIHIISTAIILTTILTIVPVINAQTISNISQAKRIQKAWASAKNFEELPKENKNTIISAYKYLKLQENFEKYIPKTLSKEKLDKALNNNENDSYYKEYNPDIKNVKYNLDKDGVVTIKGYTTMNKVEERFINLSKEELETIKIKEFSINMQKYILNVIKMNKNSEESATQYISQNRLLKINDNVDFCITQFDMGYNTDDEENLKKIIYWKIGGYILVK